MYVSCLLEIVCHQLALVPGLVGHFIHTTFNVGQNIFGILYSRKKVDRRGNWARIKVIGETSSLIKGPWSTLPTFVPKLMITPASLQVSIPSEVSGARISEHGGDGADCESEAAQRWLIQQHTIECGCCFDLYPLDKMVQCPEAHLFCKSCMFIYASNLLGEHNHNIVCMDQSGCVLHFPQSQLEQFLTPTLLDLYHRVKQRKEIEAACLKNLEECPFCDYKCIIEDKAENRFQCGNGKCGVVSCRKCKKPDHLPKSCKEAETDRKLDMQHIIEEAMSRALIRNCPKCQKAFVKERFCNKMTCPNCHTVSCYVCRKAIDGYDHFDSVSNKSECKLWDKVDTRHENEVEAAAKKAIEELQRDGKIKVDVRDQKVRSKKFKLFLPMLRRFHIRKTAT